MRRLFRSFVVSVALFVCSGTGTLLAQTQAQTVQDQKETTVYVTRTGKKYHREGCRHLAQSKIPMTLKEAKAKDYTACSVCRPPQK